GGARKSDPTFGHDTIPVPCPSVQIQQPESCEVPRVRVHLTAQNVIAESIDTWNGVAHSNSVEQYTSGKLQVLLIVANDGLERVNTKQRVVVLIIPCCTLLANDAAIKSADDGTDTAKITERGT